MPHTPCPYCGHIPASPDASRCDQCGGLFEPLSRKATQLAMGPWFVRDPARPHMPGFNEAILRQQVATGRIKADSVVRGPTTHQFWMRADQTPGLSRLLGNCHACGAAVSQTDETCTACQTDLSLPKAIDRLGLAYIDPSERQQVQVEIEALRKAGPAPTAKPAAPTPKNKAASLLVDPDLLEPVAPEQDDANDALTYLGSEPTYSELAEDLWHQDVPEAATSRRRKKRSGPDPIVLVLGVLFLCVVGIGLSIVITQTNKDNENNGDPFVQKSDNAKPKDKLPSRTQEEVAAISGQALGAFELISTERVPEPFTEDLEKARKLNEQAKLFADAKDYATAYDQFDQANKLLDDLSDRIAQWRADQAIKTEVTQLLSDVVALQTMGQSTEAQKYSSAWSRAEAALGRARPLVDQGSYSEADAILREAESAYEEAISVSRQALAALDALDTLSQAMKAGPSEQTLRQYALNEVDRLLAGQAEGARKFESGKFSEAETAYQDALSAHAKAVQAVELAKYRKVYAYEAGYGAAGVLISITTGDGIGVEALRALSDVFEKLALADNPASELRPGKDAVYADAAEQLVTQARSAITQKHGEAIQCSYQAGFQVRIIEQTLKTGALTKDQQIRTHQCLDRLQDLAATAGWDILKMREVIEKVRTANRLAKLGEAPDKVRAEFAVLIKPLQNKEMSARLMDPVLSPSRDEDPQLFPGLGSSGP